MKKCINCGENINDNALFCEHCGTLQKDKETKDRPIDDGLKSHEQQDILGSLRKEINELLQNAGTNVENKDFPDKKEVAFEKEILDEKENGIDSVDASFKIKNKTVEPQNEIDSLSKKRNTNNKKTKQNKNKDLSGLAIAVAIFVFIISCAMVISPKTFGFNNLDGIAEKLDFNGMTDSVDANFSEKISDAGTKMFDFANNEKETVVKDEKSKVNSTDNKNTDYKIIEYSGTVVKKIMIAGQVYEMDLNGDGVTETIQYKVYDYEGNDVTNDANMFASEVNMNGLYSDLHFGENFMGMTFETPNCKIIINGNETIDIDGEYYEPYILLSDIDFSDNYLEILVDGFPDASYPATTVVRYSKDRPEIMGDISGSYRYGMTVDGSGMIKAKTDGWGICSWLYDGEYIVVDGMLKEIEKEKYYMNVETTTLQWLDLYKSPGDYTVVESLGSGENVTLVYSDNKRWCYVQPENGIGGFVEITGEYGYVVNGMSSFDVFSDLPMWG